MRLSPAELALLGERLEFDAEVADTEEAFATICWEPEHRNGYLVDNDEYPLVIKTAWGCRVLRHNNQLNPEMMRAVATVVLEDNP